MALPTNQPGSNPGSNFGSNSGSAGQGVGPSGTPSQMSGQHSTVNVRHKTRAERVAAHVTYNGLFQQVFDVLSDMETRKQVALVMLTTLAMCLVTQAWDPPLDYREHEVPARDIVCCVPFVFREEPVPARPTEKTMPHVRYQSPAMSGSSVPASTPHWSTSTSVPASTAVPVSTPFPTTQSLPQHSNQLPGIQHAGLPSEPHAITQNGDVTGGSAKMARGTAETISPSPNTSAEIQAEAIQTGTSPALLNVPIGDTILPDAMLPDAAMSAPTTVNVSPREGNGEATTNLTTQGILPQGHVSSNMALEKEIQKPIPIFDNQPGQAFAFSNDLEIREFEPGIVLVKAGQSISRREFKILQAEYTEILAHRTISARFLRFFGVYCLTLALFLIAFVFLHRRERRRPKTTLGTVGFYLLMVLAVIASTILHGLSQHGANLELVPVLLLAQSIAIAFSWELSLISAVIIAFVVTLSQTNNIFTMILLVGVTASTVVHLTRLRSRTKLIAIGTFGAIAAFSLTIFVKIVEGQNISEAVLTQAGLNAFWTLAAAFLMTGLLPFIERPCGILTDMSLLDLGDVSHPLLHELIRRAPATHSHSIQVASIAETAAEAIGVRGLLVRVGAYFHDIGKILHPDFFTENQVPGQNVHDTLEPRMSTLVIVSHVKDGVDLARQHRIPQPIISLIEQHHGTSLVSFFHSLAVKQSREQGYTNPVDEGSFRYPGPRPQSKEAGILMLADAAESACRSLREAAPSKIEAMVRQIAENKLKDGQFDESGLTLHELRIIENSIINSILATRHSRIIYPDTLKVLSTENKTVPTDSGIFKK